jgi:hypothetical protein
VPDRVPDDLVSNEVIPEPVLSNGDAPLPVARFELGELLDIVSL